MRLYGVRIFVDDFDSCRAFYRETLALPENWAMPEVKAAGFAVGGGELIVEEAGPGHEHHADIGRFVGVSLQVDDIDAQHRTLADAGVRFLGPPERQDWGGALAHFCDPSGNILTLLG